ncbi:MAG: hypothetical protein K5662_09680 [Lachnospiraceae bacterium]|nr:hypothetical protein [Lachnospiraceae bacterium]
MIFLISFILSIAILLWTISNGNKFSINSVLLNLMVAIGNGGHYALYCSTKLEEAVLANKIIYLIGIFVPLLLFLTIGELCKVKIHPLLTTALFTLQLLIYGCVCSTGHNSLFYKTVEIHFVDGHAYLTKTYGPVHTLYLLTLLLYMMAGIIVTFIARSHKNVVSSRIVDSLIFTYLITVVYYLGERLLHIKTDYMSICLTLAVFVAIVAITRFHRYSISENNELLSRRMNSTGYIIFSKKLCYMNSNSFAAELFPELTEWEIDKKIPGNGARFNTYLRQPFMRFVNDPQNESLSKKTFSIKDKHYRLLFDCMKNHYGRVYGYVIGIEDITNIIDKSE